LLTILQSAMKHSSAVKPEVALRVSIQ